MAKFTRNQSVALLLISPQLLVTIIFFIWPALRAVWQSFLFSDAFGLHQRFAGLQNYLDLVHEPDYIQALLTTGLLSILITLMTMGFGVFFAYLVLQCKKSQGIYKTLFIWPYAVAPAVAALMWRFLCHPSMGWLTTLFGTCGIELNYLTGAKSALFVIVIVASWQQFSYNFLFYLAALNAIPKSLTEAAMLDGASSWQRFWQIIWPLLSPTSFFLLVMNLIYAFFDTFGIIHVITQGGPGKTTTTLMYKVYEDGFIGMDFGSAAAQSVILMFLVIGLTLLQFRALDKKVYYR